MLSHFNRTTGFFDIFEIAFCKYFSFRRFVG